MKSKKIAIIGCSHFAATEQPSQQLDNWSHLMYKEFPQHSYRNYGSGGKGIEYFQYCLLDAKRWGADIVFLNRTYPGRWLWLAETSIHSDPTFEFVLLNQLENWEEVSLNSEYIWGTVHSTSHVHNHPKVIPGLDQKLSQVSTFFRNQVSVSRTRLNWEIEWYKHVSDLYNFDLYLIDWDDTHNTRDELGDDHNVVTSNVNDIPVVHWFNKKYRATGDSGGPRPLWNFGITHSADDNHLTPKGNHELLHEYILANKNVLNSLTN